MDLVILQQLPVNETIWAQMAGKRCRVLSFSDDDMEATFLGKCRDHGIFVERIDKSTAYIDKASSVAREKYSSFIAAWPERCLIGNYNFKERFTYKGEISYWWLTSASMKDNEISEIFDYLCNLEIVADVGGQEAFAECVLLSQDPLMNLIVERWCAKAHAGFLTSCRSGLGKKYPLIKGLAGRLALLFSLLWKLIIFRVLVCFSRGESAKPAVSFFTLFPGPLEIKETRLFERNYCELISHIASQSQVDSIILAWWQGKFLRGWRGLWRTRRQHGRFENMRVVFLDSYLRPGDVGFVLKNFLFFLRYCWLDSYGRKFRDSFVYEGINVYELFGWEFRRCFLGAELPYHITIGRVVERAAKEENIQYLVCFLEMYPLARALYYGAKRAKPSIRTVAYQHANINRLKLWYTYRPEEIVSRADQEGRYIESMPIPDRYFFQGRAGRDFLTTSGYPSENCFLVGSPRYDALSKMIQELNGGKCRQRSPGSYSETAVKRILVLPALSLADAKDLIGACVRASVDKRAWRLVVKGHPDCPVELLVKKAMDRYGSKKVEVSRSSLYELILDSDVVVTSYSTAGDEAIALGRPVVCYSGARPCMSSYFDVAAAPIVRTVEDLANVLEQMLYNQSYREAFEKRRDELIEASFYRLDGLAKERFVASLLVNSANG